MYNKFFGFKEKPFKLVPNPEYLFLSKSHEGALAHLTYAVSQGDGFVEMTGEVGTGKTTLCRVFLDGLDENIEAAYIFNPKLDALQLLKTINDEFNISSAPDNIKELIDILNLFLIEQKAAGKNIIVLIDEAQNLSKEVLEQLRLLSNLETTQDKLLQIILVGQPELGEMLGSHDLRQLGQRITIHCNLSPLSFQETTEYIRHRIALASHRAGPPFDRAAYRAIYKYSHGIPRLINIACDRVLLNAFSRNSYNVTGSIAKEAIKELTKMHDTQPSSSMQRKPAFTVFATILVVSLILLLHFTFNDGPEKQVVKEHVEQPQPAVAEVREPEQPAGEQVSDPEPQPQQAEGHETPGPLPVDEVEPPRPSAPETELPVQPPADPQLESTASVAPGDAQEAAAEIAAEAEPPPQQAEQTAAAAASDEIQTDAPPGEIGAAEPVNEEPLKNIAAISPLKQKKMVVYTVHAGTFKSLAQADSLVEKLRSREYPSFLYTRTDNTGSLIYVVVAGKYGSQGLAGEVSAQLSRHGFDNFVSRARHSLYFGPPVSPEKTTINKESKIFQEFLSGLNSRHSRNSAMQEALRSWSIDTSFDNSLAKINTDRTFFHQAANRHAMLMQPLATDLSVVQHLNLPTILAIYLPGHPWPKYLTIIGMEGDNILFATAADRQPLMVNRSTLLNYWSGEAYLIWKNYLDLQGPISKSSSSDSVKNLKQFLRDMGHQEISLNQSIDEKTLLVIKNIQKKYGLEEDGIVGPLTTIALYNESNIFKKPSLTKLAQN